MTSMQTREVSLIHILMELLAFCLKQYFSFLLINFQKLLSKVLSS